MNYHHWYEENKSSILPILIELGYTPHSLVEDANKDNMDVFEFVYILLN